MSRPQAMASNGRHPNQYFHDKDYAHTEIRAYLRDDHLKNRDEIPEEIELAWREKLLRKIEVVISAGDVVEIRQNPPNSHRVEPPTILFKNDGWK